MSRLSILRDMNPENFVYRKHLGKCEAEIVDWECGMTMKKKKNSINGSGAGTFVAFHVRTLLIDGST